MSAKTFKGNVPAARISDGVATLGDEDGWASTGRWFGLEQASSRPASVKANTWLTVVIFEIRKRSTLRISGLLCYDAWLECQSCLQLQSPIIYRLRKTKTSRVRWLVRQAKQRRCNVTDDRTRICVINKCVLLLNDERYHTIPLIGDQ